MKPIELVHSVGKAEKAEGMGRVAGDTVVVAAVASFAVADVRAWGRGKMVGYVRIEERWGIVVRRIDGLFAPRRTSWPHGS